MDPKIGMGGSQDSSPEPYNQVVKVKEGRVDLEPVLLINCRVAESASAIMLNVVILKVFILSIIISSVTIPSVTTLSVIILRVILL